MADGITTALPWLDALLEEKVRGDLVLPFLERAAGQKETGWEDRAIRCLRDDNLGGAGISVLLASSETTSDLLEETIERARAFPNVVEQLCRSGEIEVARVRRLLEDDDPELVEAAASGIWERSESTPVVRELLEPWRRAVIRAVKRDYHLCEMFKQDRELAYAWLLDRAQAQPLDYRFQDNAIVAASGQLSIDRKRSILRQVSPHVFDAPRIVRALVGTDVALYRELLADTDRASLHLAPLSGEPDEDWAELAIAAADAGYSPSDLPKAAWRVTEVAFGAVHEKYETQMDYWNRLASHRNHTIKQIARVGRQLAQSSADYWRRDAQREEFFETYG